MSKLEEQRKGFGGGGRDKVYMYNRKLHWKNASFYGYLQIIMQF